MKKIYFVRHAESEANAGGIMAGSEFETPLTANGKEQARKAGEFLKGKGIELIMVSPMQRTLQTANIIAEETGIDKSKLIENPLITERAFGNYSGQPFQKYIEDAESGKIDESQLESEEVLFERVTKAFEWLSARPESTILVVSHGATGRMFRLVDQKLSHHDFRAIKRFDNAEIDEFTI